MIIMKCKEGLLFKLDFIQTIFNSGQVPKMKISFFSWSLLLSKNRKRPEHRTVRAESTEESENVRKG